jgi:Leucine-rich repeat (LRR) protein
MGGQFSSVIAEAQESGGTQLIIEENEVSTKEIAELLKDLPELLPNLTTFIVHQCKLKKLPKDIGSLLDRLKQLTMLQLDNNLLAELPNSIAVVKDSLRELSLASNKFKVRMRKNI